MSCYEPVQRFSTRDLDPKRSLDAWARYMSEVYFKLEIKASSGDAIAGMLAKRSFAEAGASWLKSDGQQVTRTRRSALEDEVECFCLVFPLAGTFEPRQRGQQERFGPGEVYLLNAQEPYEVDLSSGAEMSCLALPCDLVRPRIRGVDDLCGRRGFADPVMNAAIRRLVKGALDSSPTAEPTRLRDLCLEMTDMMVVPSARRQVARGGYAEAVADDVVDRAKRVMRKAVADPRLDVAFAAGSIGVSVRQLQKAFALSGTTFGEQLLIERLSAAAELLKREANAGRLISDIAAACGFISQAHFSTRYRERYGRTPREDRGRPAT